MVRSQTLLTAGPGVFTFAGCQHRLGMLQSLALNQADEDLWRCAGTHCRAEHT